MKKLLLVSSIILQSVTLSFATPLRVKIDSPTCGQSVSFNPHATELSAELCFTFREPSRRLSDYDCSMTINLVSQADTTVFKVVEQVKSPGDIYEHRSITLLLDGNPIKSLTSGINLHGGDNYLIFTSDGFQTNIFIGDDTPIYCATIPTGHITGISIADCHNTSIAYIVGSSETPAPLLHRHDISCLPEKATATSSSPVGIWSFLDRDNDPDYARPGGMYRLAVIPSDEVDGEYVVIYLSGAQVNDGGWEPGMMKATLSPTPFQGRYKLKWWDSMMQPLDSECHAVLDGGTLSFCFPLLHSTMRFSR